MQPSQRTDLPGIFRRAAEVIQTNGLHKGDFVAPPGLQDARGEYHVLDEALRPVDAVGAIRIACGQLPSCSVDCTAEVAVRWASEHLDGTTAPLTDGEPDYVEHVSFWSDLQAEKWTNVVARLQRLAIEAHGAGSAVAA